MKIRPVFGDTSPRFALSDRLPEVAMPMGGIGAGNVSITAFGQLRDFAIRHKPTRSALPDGWDTLTAAFATLHVKGQKPVTRLVEGPMPKSHVYDQGLKVMGFRSGGHEGLPRFARAKFRAAYPFAQVALDDPKVPLSVELTAWSPFIPGDDVASGMPCAMLEYRIVNRSRAAVSYELALHLSHPFPGKGREQEASRTEPIPGMGVLFRNTEPETSEDFGTAALVVVGHKPKIKAQWFRGGWFDGISALWREVSTGTFTANEGAGGAAKGRNGGSILLAGKLAPGASVVYPIVIAWHAPSSNQRHGEPKSDEKKSEPAWRPFYAGKWEDARAVVRQVAQDYPALRDRTLAFKNALFGSTLPAPVLDAVASNLAILKSPTILRQENGNLWCWEGCGPSYGSCHGTCTHVWNYAQAMPHLFPRLERTLREQEYLFSMDDRGHVNFRAALPDGPTDHSWHAASDGQLGGIMKLYRDFRITGDESWLRRMYPLAERSIEYGIKTWDPDEKGALVEPHHNTYDIEFWGPDGMCTTFYVGALSAMREMATVLGEQDDVARYGTLAQRAAAYLDDNLYNGDYFYQKVMWDGLRDKSFAKQIADAAGTDVGKLLEREGPKYQYGVGCISDGVIGIWMADLYGIPTPVRSEHVTSHLRAVFRHNFKKSLREHANCQRPGYAIGDEPGLLLCTWPNGQKPTLPFPYSDEVWTGIEYQVASHCILRGLVKEGLAIVAGARARYDGSVRNPFDEYECGAFYARAMASYAVLVALTGFCYVKSTRTLELAPKIAKRPMTAFFSADGAWGTFTLDKAKLTIDVIEGELAVDEVVFEGKRVTVQSVAKAGKKLVVRLSS